MGSENINAIKANNFIDMLPGRVDTAINAVRKTSSPALFESRMQENFEGFLDEAPKSVKAKVEAYLVKRGYKPDLGSYESDEGECGMTGIDTDCCPCGHHP